MIAQHMLLIAPILVNQIHALAIPYARDYPSTTPSVVVPLSAYPTPPGASASIVDANMATLQSRITNQTGNIGLQLTGLNAYFAEVLVGTPAQKFYLDVDTGSSALWIPSSACITCHSIYKFSTANSTTFRFSPSLEKQQLANVTYAAGQIQAYTGRDTVKLGKFKVVKQEFYVAQAEDSYFQQVMTGVNSGKIGLAYQGGVRSATFKKSFLGNLLKQKKLAKPIFTIWINNNTVTPQFANTTVDGAGKLTLGAINHTLYNGSISYIPLVPISIPLKDQNTTVYVNSSYYWSISTPEIRVNTSTNSTLIKPGQTVVSLVDVGSTLISIDSSSLNSLVNRLNNLFPAPILVFNSATLLFEFSDCTPKTLDALPDIVFKAGPKLIELPLKWSEYIVRTTSSSCALGIQAHDLSRLEQKQVIWVLGSLFLKKYYSVFDYEHGRVGFALSNSA